MYLVPFHHYKSVRMSGSCMRITVWRFCASISPWQTSGNSSKEKKKKLSEKRNVIYYWWLSSRLYNSLTLQIMLAVVKTLKHTHTPTAALTGCTWARPSGSAWLSWWGCTSAARPVGARRRTSAPVRTVPSTRRYNSAGKRRESKVSRDVCFFLGLVKSVSSVHGAARAAGVHPHSAEWSSQPLWLESPSKGYSFQSWMKD